MKEEILKYIEQELKDIEELVWTRAYGDKPVDKELLSELLDVEMFAEPLRHYDGQDMENHNFDLGCHYALRSLKTWINEKH